MLAFIQPTTVDKEQKMGLGHYPSPISISLFNELYHRTLEII